MKMFGKFLFLGALLLMWWNLRVQSVNAQGGGCRNAESDLFSPSCAATKSACISSATSSRNDCYVTCDQKYGSGTSADKTCRSQCDTTYNSQASTCNANYNNCLQTRANSCYGYCQGFCSGTSGIFCCSYNDGISGCNYACGCTMPPPLTTCNCDASSLTWSCSSPILIDVNGDGFKLTSPEDGVFFDLLANHNLWKWAWTAAETDDGFLALDRNGNGTIDDGTELFGSVTPQTKTAQPNGFLALAVYDKPENGGNGDGFIDPNDAIYQKLLIWVDKNHDGISQPDELHHLADLGIGRIDLQYEVHPKTDQYGNVFRLRSRVWDLKGFRGGRWAWDVYFNRVQ